MLRRAYIARIAERARNAQRGDLAQAKEEAQRAAAALQVRAKEQQQQSEQLGEAKARETEGEARRLREQLAAAESAVTAAVEEKDSVAEQAQAALDRLTAHGHQARLAEHQWTVALQQSQQLNEEKDTAMGLLQREVERLRDERAEMQKTHETKLATLLQRIEAIDERHAAESADKAAQHEAALAELRSELTADHKRVQLALVDEQRRLAEEVKQAEAATAAQREKQQAVAAELFTQLQQQEGATMKEASARAADRTRLEAEFEAREAEIVRLHALSQAAAARFTKLEEALSVEKEATALERDRVSKYKYQEVQWETKEQAAASELHEMAVEREHRLQKLHFLQKELGDKSDALMREQAELAQTKIQIAQLKAVAASREEASASQQESDAERELKYSMRELQVRA